jgi:hypothetical protein
MGIIAMFAGRHKRCNAARKARGREGKGRDEEEEGSIPRKKAIGPLLPSFLDTCVKT